MLSRVHLVCAGDASPPYPSLIRTWPMRLKRAVNIVKGERFEKSQCKRKKLNLSLFMALSGTLQLTSNYIPGYRGSDSRSISNSAVSKRTLAVLPYSSCLVHIENGRYARKRISLVCRASSSGHRRNNPDFSRNNRNGFRGRNRRNEDRDSLDGGGVGGVEDSDILSSKNGPVFSLSNSPKFQATSSPGPREKDIVDLFRKVQAQLRARAAAKKEDKKAEEASKGQGGKETETVDSLLKLLRKHSGEQGKKKAGDFNSEKQLQGDADDDDAERQVHSSNHFNSRNRDHNATPFTRPASSFRRNSPVPRHKPQSSYSSEAIFDEASSYSVTWTQKKDQVDSRDEPEYEPEYEPEPEPEPALSLLESEPELKPESFYHEEDEVAVDALSDDESINAEEDIAKDEDLSALKLIELRAIAKSRGLKGISKMKKAELVNLLCSNEA
ncbi:unnamed protein product [Eruca vesicaria subsp. sativa]|uniref:Rho termination factor-like N-terminal domain-containing protein n=1 Tax=Eruca vesicaria subsp. sativa TaxID=29727 RepID=A0ABC8KJ64_ERUVS|nr:unnamed protein product [Eruca vesicaria subsp. sativa]